MVKPSEQPQEGVYKGDNQQKFDPSVGERARETILRSNGDDRVQGFERNFEIPSVVSGDYNGTGSCFDSIEIPTINDLRDINQRTGQGRSVGRTLWYSNSLKNFLLEQ